MRRMRTAVELGALLSWSAGAAWLFFVFVPAALLATGVLLAAVSWLLDGPA